MADTAEGLTTSQQERAKHGADTPSRPSLASGDPAFDTLDSHLRRVAVHLDRLKGEIEADEREQASHRVDVLGSAVGWLRQFVWDLQWLAELEDQHETPRRVALDDVLDSVMANLREDLGEADALVARDPLPTVWARPGDMRVIFEELLKNALRFRGTHDPVIRITAQREGDWWVVSFEDNGRGFHPEQARDLFEVGLTLEGTGLRAGSGVGLAACQRLVQRNYGTMVATAEPEHGARFTVRLHGGAPATAA